ncbi:coiled-coil domain-containing protein 169-like isoform X9 [Mya arenaria]|uniref:coiled-coil domain-containing protein 169-like isoform X9 n=1 Tax=Mya arenaria TaxID=6604 RepID=UPI0022E32F65|nr:coiled-coil domain-containing protein 169-like isoform X9 [Mya arenaria]
MSKMGEEVDEYELEKIRAEIQQERQMKEMLDQSAKELRITVEELEKRYEAIENEDPDLGLRGNEWKTRFETQEEMNQQLERQIIMLQDKIEEAKRNLKDARAYVEGRAPSPRTGADTPKSKSTGITINISVSPQAGKTPRDMKSFDDLSDYISHLKRLLEIESKANPQMVKTMEREKQQLYNQLRDLEWRLDQESKAYHKANDERKQYVLEINATKGNIDGNKARQRAAVGVQQREVDEMSRSPRLMGRSRAGSKSRRSSFASSTMGSRVPSLRYRSWLTQNSRARLISNIPEDQRIIDPRRGPIKKTAAVKNLPSLELRDT